MRTYAVKLNNQEHIVNLVSKKGSNIEFEISGQNFSVDVAPVLNLNRNSGSVANSALSSSSNSGEIKAPMPGIIVNIVRAEGSKVAAGDTILVIEAMKMENNIAAPRAGIVKKINVKATQEVVNGQVLGLIE
ncbi:MAG: biotin/lipoyl-containing protein [bacterium]|nr:biotin/lipoyl-containing protein [bacterium]